MARTLAASAFPRIPVLRNRRFCAGLLAENTCRAYACLNLTLPDLVILKRLAAVRLVLIFGMVAPAICEHNDYFSTQKVLKSDGSVPWGTSLSYDTGPRQSMLP